MNFTLVELGVLFAVIMGGIKLLEKLVNMAVAKYQVRNGKPTNPGSGEVMLLLNSIDDKLGNIDNTLDGLSRAIAELKGMIAGGK